MRRTAVLAVLLTLAACTGDPATPDRSAPAAPGADTLAWRPLAAVPTPRTEVAAAADAGGLIHVVGGYTADGATVATVEVLDTATGRWTAGPDLPIGVNHAMAATVDGAVYVFGGYLDGNVPSAAAFRLEPAGWRRLADLPAGLAAGTAVTVGPSVYLAGGIATGGGLSDRTLVYDTAADRWSTAAGLPTPREHLGGAGFGGLVYTVGGRTAAAATSPHSRSSTPVRVPGPRGPTCPPGGAGSRPPPPATVRSSPSAARPRRPSPRWRPTTSRPAGGRRCPTCRRRGTGSGWWRSARILYTLAGGPHPGLHVADSTEAIDVAPLGPCR